MQTQFFNYLFLYMGLLKTVDDQVRAFFWKELAVDENAAAGPLPHILVRILRRLHQEIIKYVVVLLHIVMHFLRLIDPVF